MIIYERICGVRYMSDDSVKEVLRKFYRVIAIFSRDFRYPGYTLNDAVVLGIVARHPGIIASNISEYCAIDRGYLSKTLKKLESRGLVDRELQNRPPFEKLLNVTPLGVQIYNEIEELVDRSVDEHLSVLSDDEMRGFQNEIFALLQSLNKVVPDYPDSIKKDRPDV